MLKHFLHFSLGQRIAIAILLLLIACAIVADLCMERWAPQPTSFVDEAYRNEVQAFEKSLTAVAPQTPQTPQPKQSTATHTPRAEQQVELFAFDPNTVDSAQMLRLGIKPRIASNIIKYRNKGGRFTSADDFGKIYGISTEQLEQLRPYITIAPQTPPMAEAPSIYSSIDINNADTTALKAIVSPSLAKRIVGYRNLLGGFANVAQLSEIKGITPKQLSTLEQYITIDTTRINAINVNTASIDRLKRHPYINFYQARDIIELRKAKRQLKHIDELKHLDSFSTTDLERLTPYLIFE